ncbi:type II toxin-antitoxin system RnlB family antitoxin [Clostridium botulinum]|uniref:type II toxin-antitoxin system RnlB family antitoxin n=1 Tax=Clostridium botulinum TaxID=1491 RepID=UPI00037FA3C2|nr:type II toxin-antitoxin system RnlB family antitoxin [Clostridium botulinum]
MKRYEINVLREENKCIIFSTTYVSPLDFIKDIENELRNVINYSVEVVFDLLLSSGNSQERFGRINYTGNEFDMKSFQFINVPKKNDLRKVAVSYYKDKDENLDNSILTSMQKKMIKKGIAI